MAKSVPQRPPSGGVPPHSGRAWLRWKRARQRRKDHWVETAARREHFLAVEVLPRWSRHRRVIAGCNSSPAALSFLPQPRRLSWLEWTPARVQLVRCFARHVQRMGSYRKQLVSEHVQLVDGLRRRHDHQFSNGMVAFSTPVSLGTYVVRLSVGNGATTAFKM